VNKILIGDCLVGMKSLIADNVKVQTCVTSPPYFGLRDYGTAKWEGGDPACDHQPSSTQGTNGQRADRSFTAVAPYRAKCGKCGALRIDNQIGLEETPQKYVARMVEVFRLVRELLADDGTLWLNLGDSYANDGKWGGHNKRYTGLKPKDLIGIPWRVAFALQEDGWYLRSDIIWAKPNPMPESVADRPTKSHEYIFLLSKSADYFYDAEAIKEEVTGQAHARGNGVNPKCVEPGNGIKQNSSFSAAVRELISSRNKRSVWTVGSAPYAGAHFATFPPDLILPCVLAGSRPGDVVFDPFMGSGTTALVAKRNGRLYLGCELNPEYRALWEERLAQEVLFGSEVTA
jgi:DNA modification methylase